MTIEMVNVTKCVGSITHIKDTSLKFEPGIFHVLLGKTGSGKTSLLKLMAGLDPVSSGSIRFDGKDVTHLSPQKRNIGLVHQFFVNYPHMNVYDNIASPLRVAGVPQSELVRRVEETAKLLQLNSVLDKKPNELSGGQQQRTAIARAIAKNSKAVFLDEPLANLDYKLREELRDQLPDLFAGRGSVVVYATSEPEEALLLGGKTALMEDGYVVQYGPTDEVYRHPMNFTSAMAFSNPPINQARVSKVGNEVHMQNFAKWMLDERGANLKNGEYILAVRANHVSPVKLNKYTVPLVGSVQVTEISGSESSAHFRFGNNEWTSLSHGVHRFGIGENHQFYMNPDGFFYFHLDGRSAT